MPEPLLDLDLLRAVQAGDPDALARLYERYADGLYALALRLTHETADAQDAVHDVFLGLPGALHTYEASGSFEAWLKKVTTRVVLAKWRQRERELSLLGWSHLVPRARPVDPTDWIALERAIGALPRDLRVVFVLHKIECLTHQEIGELLGIRWRTSGQRLYRAMRRLRSALDGWS